MTRAVGVFSAIVLVEALAARIGCAEVIPDSFAFVKGDKPLATIVVGSRVENQLRAAKVLAESVRQISGVELAISAAGEKAPGGRQILVGTPAALPSIERMLDEDKIVMTPSAVKDAGYVRWPVFEDLGEQGFIIHKAKRGDNEYLLLAGNTPVGALYAVNTLVDRLHWEADDLLVDGLKTRLAPTINVPAFQHRSLQTAVGGPDWVATDQYMKEFGYDYRSFVDWLASHKINNVLLHDTCLTWGLFYESDELPELVNKNSPNIKQEYIRPMIEYGRECGVTFFALQNFPDRCDSVAKTHPEAAGVDAQGKPHRSSLCAAKPGTMEIWKRYWRDFLSRYPVAAVGCQFSEGLDSRCCCSFCRSDASFRKNVELFDAMRQIARAQNPPVKSWIWSTPGARDILARRSSYPDLIVIDWGLQHHPFIYRNYIPRGDWYLYHMYGKNPEFGMKHVCEALNRCGVKGVQIRAVEFKPRDRVFQHFEEFAWNPELSIEDYAHLYTIKALRRKHAGVAEAYAHYIRAQGYRDVVAQKGRKRSDNRAHRAAGTGLQIPDHEWLEFEGYEKKLRDELAGLSRVLSRIDEKSEFVDWLRTEAKKLGGG